MLILPRPPTAGNIYSIGVRTTIGTIAEGNFELIAKTKPVRILAINVAIAAATASQFGFGFPAAAGVTPTEVTLPSTSRFGHFSTATCAVAWGGARPTAPAKFIARFNTSTTLGTFRAFEFDDLWVPVSQTFTVHNITATGVADINIVIEEDPRSTA